MNQRRSRPNPIFLLLGVFIGASMMLYCVTQFSHVPGVSQSAPLPPATSEMPVPEIEMIEPTAEGKLETKKLEKAMLKKLENAPEDSPERFAEYGTFAQQAEGYGMYEIAEDYYKKAFEIGPAAYKTYFSPESEKSVGDFQLNWISMYTNTGRTADAASAAQKVYAQEVAVLGEDNSRSIDAGTTLASALGDAKKFQEKQVLSEKLIATLQKNGNTKGGEYVTALRCLGESYQGQNKLPEAKKWYLKAQKVAHADRELRSYLDNLNQTVASFASVKAAN